MTLFHVLPHFSSSHERTNDDTHVGAVMAIYINFGVDPCHLLTASVMSAPAALAISKLVYPEDEIRHREDDDAMLSEMNQNSSDNSQPTNIIEAAAEGASVAVGFVGNIVGMLISFLSLIGMLDAWMAYLGSRVGYPELSLTKITGRCYKFYLWIYVYIYSNIFIFEYIQKYSKIFKNIQIFRYSQHL